MGAAAVLTDQFSTASTFTTYSQVVSLGPAAPDRVIVVGAVGRSAANVVVSSVTVDGVAAPRIAGATTTTNSTAALFSLPYPTGTTATVEVAFSAAVVRGGFAIFAVTGSEPTAGSSGTSVTTASTTPASVTAAVERPGLALAVAYVTAASAGANGGQRATAAAGRVAPDAVTASVSTTSTQPTAWTTLGKVWDPQLSTASAGANVQALAVFYDAAQAAAPVGGASATVLSSVRATAPATLAIIGAAAVTLVGVAGAGAGGAAIAATAQPALQGVATSAAGSLPIIGNAGGRLDAFTAEAVSALSIGAASAGSIAPIATASSARADVAGRLSTTLGDVGVASGAGSGAQVFATSGVVLSPVGTTSGSSLRVAANAVSTLGQVTASGGAASAIRAAAGTTLGAVTGNGSAALSITAAGAGMMAPIRLDCTATVTRGQQSTPIVISLRNRFIVPARQRRFTIPGRPRSFLIRKGFCMQSITKYAAEERQYQADWSADINGQTIVGEIAATSSDPSLIVDRVTYDGPLMKFWVQGGTSGRVATIRFVAPTSGGEDLAWQQTVVVY